MQSKRGMVLLMVLAVLTLLCLLGLMFVLMANMERATARAYLDMVRAKMIAQSGIHSAMVNTRALLTEKGFDIKEMEYYGEDLNGDGIITGGLESYENQDSDNKLQTSDCLLYRAVRPSFMFDRDQDGDLDKDDLINVQGKWVGVSGIMPGPYDRTIGAYYSLKVEDLSGKIFINCVEDADEKNVLKSVLGNLTHELFGKASIGYNLAAAAPFANLDEVRTKLAQPPYNTKLTEAEFTQLKSCLTTYVWRDTTVIKPVPLEARLRDEYNAPVYPGDDVFTWRSIRPLMIGYPMATDYSGVKRLIGRAPVNINTAPEAVLSALIKDLAGLYLDPTVGFEVIANSGQFPGIAYSYNSADIDAKKGMLGRLSATVPISRDQARAIAQAIIQNRNYAPDFLYPWRGTFRSWQQFNAFCDEVLWRGNDPHLSSLISSLLTPQQADVLKANFNPNTNLPELNPPYQRLFWVGKDNLTGSTGQSGSASVGRSFEFSFFPTGYFLVTSLGRLLGPENNVLSESEIQATVQLFSLYRETNQKDFLEDFWSRRSQITEIIKPHTDFGDTYQYTMDNLTLQSYPEILEYDSYQAGYCRNPDLNQSLNLRNPYIQDAHYDGYITLATTENQDISPAPNFRASFNKSGLNADKPVNLACQPDTFGPKQNRLIAPDNLDKNERKSFRLNAGTLFPDGLYIELDSVPMYNYRPPDLDNFTVSLWLKPIFFPEYSAKTRVYLTYQVWGAPIYQFGGAPVCGPTAPLGIYNIANRNYSISPINNGENWSAYGYADIYNQAWDHTSFLGGGYRAPGVSDASAEVSPCLNHRLCTPQGNHPGYSREGTYWGDSIFRAGKWMYLGWIHGGIFTATGYNGHFPDTLCINGKWVQGDFLCSISTEDRGATFNLPQNILRLGERRSVEALNSAPDSTLDEVLIWADKNSANGGLQITQNIWQQGRYYRGNDGYFTSRAIDLCQQARLPTGTPMTVFMVNWTQYVSEEKWTNNGQRIELSLPGQVGAPTCEIEILGAGNKELRGVRKSNPTKPPDPGGELIKDTYTGGKLTVTAPIRYRVKFLPNVDPINDILVDPLIFDDITIIYYSVPKFLSWAYRR